MGFASLAEAQERAETAAVVDDPAENDNLVYWVDRYAEDVPVLVALVRQLGAALETLTTDEQLQGVVEARSAYRALVDGQVVVADSPDPVEIKGGRVSTPPSSEP